MTILRPDDWKTPFRFEDLNGKPEPEEWGPVYPGLAAIKAARRSATVDRPLAFKSNCASGQPFEFDAAKHRAKLLGLLASAAERDKRAWATGEDIRNAYEAGMAAKRQRLAREAERPSAVTPMRRVKQKPAKQSLRDMFTLPNGQPRPPAWEDAA